jgi:ATP-binding cassette, subfamily C (CFTR/MRP), member 1
VPACLTITVICVPILSPILTFAVFTAGTHEGGDSSLSISKAFTAYSLLILVNKPLVEIILSLPMVTMAATAFSRIQKYVNGKERVDNRLRPNAHVGRSDSEKHVVNPKQSQPSGDGNHHVGNMQDPSAGIFQKTEEDNVASITGTFRWTDDDPTPTVDITNLQIQRHTLTLVLGPVGCGKSTLIKALLGELSSFEGTVSANYSRIAYCSQSPWITHDTVRNVILGASTFDEALYDQVIKACALEHDIHDWPHGDQTVAGTKGISMSGGQNHRLVCFSASGGSDDHLSNRARLQVYGTCRVLRCRFSTL